MFKYANMGQGISHRFVISIAWMMIAFLVMLSVGTYILGYFRLQETNQQRLHTEAEHFLESLGLRIDHIIDNAQRFANSSIAVNSLIDESGRSSYLPEAVNEFSHKREVKSVLIFDFLGNVIESSVDPAGLVWYQATSVKNAVSLGRVTTQFYAGSGSLLLLVPINYYDTAQGGIAVEIDLAVVLKDIAGISQGLEFQLVLGGDWASATVNEALQAHKKFISVQAPLSHPLSRHEAVLRASLSEDFNADELDTWLLQLAAVGFIGIVISLFIANRLGQRLAAPIQTLVQRIEDEVHPVGPIGTRDELEILASTIDEQTRNLLEAKAELEDRVAQRTVQLRQQTVELEEKGLELEQANRSMAAANVELTKLDKLKDEFISTVSHELRTPLTSIHGSLSLIVGGVFKDKPDKLQELFELAHNNTRRLIVLINDLLDFNRLVTGKLPMDMAPVNVEQFIREVIADSQGYAQKYHVDIQFDGVCAATSIRGDRARLHQVLDNLLSNAIKYSPNDKPVKIFVASEQHKVRIHVRDYGEGVPEHFKKRIFTKFSQADSSDTRARAGTGLGLAIAKSIVEAHGGSIGFRNETDGGACFWIEFDESVDQSTQVEESSRQARER